MARFVLLVLVVAVVAVVKFLPWWGGVLVGVGVLVAAKFLLPRFLRRLFVQPFVAKGRVLRGAQVQVLDAVPAEPFESSEPIPEGAKLVSLELMIEPPASEGPFQAWEPCSLELVRADAPPEDPYSDDDGDAGPDEAPPDAVLGPVEVWQDGAWVRDEGFKLQGPQRLRLKAALVAPVRAFKFRYYFEDFGSLPRALAA